MAADKDRALDVLRDEYKRCTDSIARDIGFGQQGMAFWTAIAALLFGVSWNTTGPLMLVVPFLFFYLIFHSLYRARMISLNSQYASELEVAINKEVGRDILRWESQICPGNARQSDAAASIIALVGSICTVTGALVHFLSQHHGRVLTDLALAEAIVSAPLAAIAVTMLWRLFQDAGTGLVSSATSTGAISAVSQPRLSVTTGTQSVDP